MKSQILALRTAALIGTALVLAASAAAATPSASGLDVQSVEHKADRLLSEAGVGPQSPPISVRATLAPDGHVTGLKVLRSSGSPQTDRAVKEVLRKLLVANAPIGLLDGAVTLNVSDGVGLVAQDR